ncbi:MAG TPA: preprotein translocase subunit YajC [Acidimicrobiales bacterium]|nr:preprotein translocase subunit YajC [Acidimicrobiales bacterium]
MHALAAVLIAATSKSNTSSGSSAISLIYILLIGLAAYFFFIRPRSRQARQQRETLQEIGPGDEILTGAGIFGTVLDVAADRVTIETAPGTRITILRSTIARRIEPQVADGVPDAWHDEEREGVAWDEHDHEHGDEYDEHDQTGYDEGGHEDDGEEGHGGHGGRA